VKRRFFTVVCAVSLLLCVGMLTLWYRSYAAHSRAGDADSLDVTHVDPLYWFVSNPGKLIFCRQIGTEWGQPRPLFQFLGLELAGSWNANSSLVNLFVPYWMIAVPTALLPTAWIRLWSIRRRSLHLTRLGLCATCGYDLRGTPNRCPECGALAGAKA